MKDNELEKICETYLSVGVHQVNEVDEIPTRAMERENPTNVGGSQARPAQAGPAMGVDIAASGTKQALTDLAASLRGGNIPSNIRMALAKISKDTQLNVQPPQLETILTILASVISETPTKQSALQQRQKQPPVPGAGAPQRLGGQLPKGAAPVSDKDWKPKASSGPKPWQDKISG